MFVNKGGKQRMSRAGLSGDGEVAIDPEYPTRLNFYQKVPMLEISIEEFEQFALDRLQGNAVVQVTMTDNLTNL
jgi:DNA primase large subunit